MSAGRATLRLGAEQVRSEYVEDEDIKGKEDLLADKGEELVAAQKEMLLSNELTKRGAS